MNGNKYNDIYSLLVKDSNDFVGMIAYTIYKRQKIEFINDKKSKEGRPPNSKELEVFYNTSKLQASIDSYLEQGRKSAEDMMDNALIDRLFEAEEKFINSSIVENLNKIHNTLEEKKGWMWWIKSIGTNIAEGVLNFV